MNEVLSQTPPANGTAPIKWYDWRGIGTIPMSGYHLREEFAAHDAEKIFDVAEIATLEPAIYISGEILRGIKKPHDCPAFAVKCTPENPLGAPMVSSEGACAAYYHYGRRQNTSVQPELSGTPSR